MHTKFHGDQRLTVMSSINCINSSFCNLKEHIKDEFKDQKVNYIRLAWKLACMLKTNRKCDPTVGLSKYESNNKLLVGVTFSKVTSSINWTQRYIP